MSGDQGEVTGLVSRISIFLWVYGEQIVSLTFRRCDLARTGNSPVSYQDKAECEQLLEEMGSSQSRTPPPFFPLGCILRNWSKIGGGYLIKDKMRHYCNQEWTQIRWWRTMARNWIL